MNNADRIARLESLLATVTRRAAEPRPARGTLAAVGAASVPAATSAAPAPAPKEAAPAAAPAPEKAAPTPPVSAAASEPAARKTRIDPRAEPEAETQHTRPTAPPPSDALSQDLEFSMPGSVDPNPPRSTPSGEFEIRAHGAAPPPTPVRKSVPPAAPPASIALDLDLSVPSSDAGEMEVDHAPLAVHANSVMPPSGAVPVVRVAAQPIPLDLSPELPSGEEEAERFAAPLLSEPDAVVYTDASAPAGPPSFRALLLRSLSLRAR